MQQIQAHLSVEAQRLERKARNTWVAIVVGLLGLQVLIGVFAIYLANSDPTVAIIPDYYEKAVGWDETRESLELTNTLGWEVNTAIAPVFDGQRQVLVSLSSRTGSPIVDVSLSGQVFHHARGAEIYELNFESLGDGRYQAYCDLENSGLWNLELQIEGVHGTAAFRSDLQAP